MVNWSNWLKLCRSVFEEQGGIKEENIECRHRDQYSRMDVLLLSSQKIHHHHDQRQEGISVSNRDSAQLFFFLLLNFTVDAKGRHRPRLETIDADFVTAALTQTEGPIIHAL